MTKFGGFELVSFATNQTCCRETAHAAGYDLKVLSAQ